VTADYFTVLTHHLPQGLEESVKNVPC